MFISIIKILEYDKIDVSKGIDINKTNESKECMLWNYWSFLNKNFSYGPSFYDGCYNIVQKTNDSKNIATVHFKKGLCRIYFQGIKNLKQKN